MFESHATEIERSSGENEWGRRGRDMTGDTYTQTGRKRRR